MSTLFCRQTDNRGQGMLDVRDQEVIALRSRVRELTHDLLLTSNKLVETEEQLAIALGFEKVVRGSEI